MENVSSYVEHTPVLTPTVYSCYDTLHIDTLFDQCQSKSHFYFKLACGKVVAFDAKNLPEDVNSACDYEELFECVEEMYDSSYPFMACNDSSLSN